VVRDTPLGLSAFVAPDDKESNLKAQTGRHAAIGFACDKIVQRGMLRCIELNKASLNKANLNKVWETDLRDLTCSGF
jgi:hypothetical protein